VGHSLDGPLIGEEFETINEDKLEELIILGEERLKH
jgi:hypothetical protein